MAEEDKKLHGEPLHMPSTTGEPLARAPLRVHIPIEFYFEDPDGKTYRIPDDRVPARARDRVMRGLLEGQKGLEKPPSNPQPNDKFGALIPPPSVEKDEETKLGDTPK